VPQIISWQARQGLGMEVSNGGKATLVQSGGSRKDTKGCQRADPVRITQVSTFRGVNMSTWLKPGSSTPRKSRVSLGECSLGRQCLAAGGSDTDGNPQEKKKAAADQESFD
jgi:hypothetical protein